MTRRLVAAAVALAVLFGGPPAQSEPVQLRIATFHSELGRDGPGLLLRDIRRGRDAQIDAVIKVIGETAPDILLLQGLDWGHDGQALNALNRRLDQPYRHLFAPRPNAGLATGLDMDGDGRTGGPGDAQSYGTFTGQGGMALLSRLPVDRAGARDFSTLLWRDLPGALLPVRGDGSPFPSAQAQAAQRLPSHGHWVVPVVLPDGRRLTVGAFHAAPPVFDGPEDRNGRRNHDEARFWTLFLDGQFGPAPDGPFVLIGDANLDPDKSDGRPEAMRALLSDPRLQDPVPQGAADAATVDWPPPGPGQMRVSYVLPSRDLHVTGSGVFWPAPGQPGAEAALTASRHRLVWVDLSID